MIRLTAAGCRGTAAVLSLMVLAVGIAGADPLFADGYEAGQDSSGNFINWDETAVYGGQGSARAIDDTLIHHQGRHGGRFEVTDGTMGGWSYTSKRISWPETRKLWYRCWLRNGPSEQSNVTIGGVYFLEAYIVHPSGYRERANIETHPYHGLPDSLFMLRMAYRGRDGQRHRQYENLQFVRRETWHQVTMLVDFSGENPVYAWWLDGNLIWSATDTTSGSDTLAPTEFHAGVCWVDWATGNRAQVWIDDCLVTAEDPVAVSDPISDRSAGLTGKAPTLNWLVTSGTLKVTFVLDRPEKVNLAVYDPAGNLAAKPLDGLACPAGVSKLNLPIVDLRPGIYFLHLETTRGNATGKICLLTARRHQP
ncbi:MAG: T9SS type A sorting domain-containing protein [candidate division WOR-3 bacterium]